MTAQTGWIDYDRHARTRPRDDVWGQVRRTVGGRAVPQAQIDMIVESIGRRLVLKPTDTVLDIACGNGALSHALTESCASLFGVDVSEYLIGIANERFAGAQTRFRQADAAAWVETDAAPERFDKALCYGSFSYLTDEEAGRMLRAMLGRYANVTHLLLGNLPDPDRALAFYPTLPHPALNEPRSDIGVWRSAAQIAELAGPGWCIERSIMPEGFFARHYRFDLLLRRAA